MVTGVAVGPADPSPNRKQEYERFPPWGFLLEIQTLPFCKHQEMRFSESREEKKKNRADGLFLLSAVGGWRRLSRQNLRKNTPTQKSGSAARPGSNWTRRLYGCSWAPSTVQRERAARKLSLSMKDRERKKQERKETAADLAAATASAVRSCSPAGWGGGGERVGGRGCREGAEGRVWSPWSSCRTGTGLGSLQGPP